MASLELITSSLFEKEYPVDVRVIKSSDTVYRKNRDFAAQSLRASGFAKIIVSLVDTLSPECTKQILGDVTLEDYTVDNFCSVFLKTNCKHHINFHDDKLCTVEFLCKFSTTLGELSVLDDDILSELHLDITTPVGSVQV